MRRLYVASKPLFLASWRARCHPINLHCSAGYAATKGKGKADSLLNPADKLEKDGSRILQVLRSRAEERSRLMAEENTEPAEGSSTTTQIQRAKKIKEMESLHQAWDDWKHNLESLREAYLLLHDSDPTMRSLAETECEEIISDLAEKLSTTFPKLLIPPSPTAEFSAIIEIKAGVGGDEAALFVSEVLRMYTRIAASNRLGSEIVSQTTLEGSKGSAGGIRDAILEVNGKGSYDLFRWESGIHRVQRVPATETQGRVHTSTIAVVVLPSSEATSEDVEDDIVNPKDVRTEVMRSRGAGGQHVNKTESAIRLTHEPTGISVSMQDSRSQHQNRAKAWQILRARLLDRKLLAEMQQRRDVRRQIVRGADRSDKIRTYNVPQDRMTDHRINYSANNLEEILEGDGLEPVIEALKRDHEMSLMEDLLNG